MKTIVILASKRLHFDHNANIKNLPVTIRKAANFILIVNENLYSQALKSYQAFYNTIIPVPVQSFEDGLIVEYKLEPLKNLIEKIMDDCEDPYFIAPDEFNIAIVESVLKKYNSPVWNKNTAKVCRDKLLMKTFMSKHGIRVPQFRALDQSSSFCELKSELGLPFVVKPIDFAGSFGVEIIKSEHDYNAFQLNSRQNITYQAEEYIEGTLYQIDTVRFKMHQYSSISEHSFPIIECCKEGKPLGALIIPESDDKYASLINCNKKVMEALNNEGCFHLELFIADNGEVVFLEIGWRQSGPPTTHPFEYQYNYTQTLIYICLLITNGAIGEIVNKDHYTIEYWIPKKTGKYKGFDLPAVSGDVKVEHVISPGSNITTNAVGYYEISTKINVTYADGLKNYKKVARDFNIIKNVFV